MNKLQSCMQGKEYRRLESVAKKNKFGKQALLSKNFRTLGKAVAKVKHNLRVSLTKAVEVKKIATFYEF